MNRIKFLIILLCSILIFDFNNNRSNDVKKALTFFEEQDYQKALDHIDQIKNPDSTIQYIKSSIYFQLAEYTNVIKIGMIKDLNPYLSLFNTIYLASSHYELGYYQQSIEIIDTINGQETIFKLIQSKILGDNYYKLNQMEYADKHYSFLMSNIKKIRIFNHLIKKEFFGQNIEDNTFRSLFTIYQEKQQYTNAFLLFDNYFSHVKSNKKEILSYLYQTLKSNQIIINKSILFNLGKALFEINQKESSSSIFLKIISDPTNDYFKLKSYYYLSLINKEDKSVFTNYLNTMLTQFSSSDEALYYYARSLFLNGYYPEAIMHYNSILTNNLNINIVKNSFSDLIALYKKLGNEEEYFNTILLFYNRFKTERTSNELYFKLCLEYIHKNRQKAIPLFKVLLLSKYYSKEAKYFLAKLYFQNREYSETLKYLFDIIKGSYLDFYYIQSLKIIDQIPAGYYTDILKNIDQYKNQPIPYNFLNFIFTKQGKFKRNVMREIKQKYNIRHLVYGEKTSLSNVNEQIKYFIFLNQYKLSLESNIFYHLYIKEYKNKNEILKILLYYFIQDNRLTHSLNYRSNLLYAYNLSPYLLCFNKKELTYYYPTHYQEIISPLIKKINPKLPSSLIYALIREESRFNKAAISPSQAMGLFQIIPSTAKYLLKKLKYTHEKTLFNPEINAYLGISYFNHLYHYYKDTPLSLGAYNAGMGRIKQWKKEYTYDKEFPEAFIELIPFSETKNYIKKIILSQYFYERL